MNDTDAPSRSDTLGPLLAALSGHLGHQLSADADGQCALLFDDDIEVVAAAAGALVTIRARLDTARLDTARVDAATGPQAASRLRHALALNYGALPPEMAVALDVLSDQILLLARLPAAATSGAEFVATVADIVALVPELRAALAGGDAEDAPQTLDVSAYMTSGIRG